MEGDTSRDDHSKEQAQMEPLTGIVLGGKAVAKAADSASKTKLFDLILGPLFTEVGISWANAYRARNAESIAKKAARSIDGSKPGSVNPRLAYRILQDGSLVDEEVMQEYLAGMLSASRTERGEDDRATYYADIAIRLTANQIRLHHAIYAALAQKKEIDLRHKSVLDKNALLVLVDDAQGVILPVDNVENSKIIAESLIGLKREGLIGDVFAVSSAIHLGLGPRPLDTDSLVIRATPTQIGCHFALWAHGINTGDIGSLSKTVACNFEEEGPHFARYAIVSTEQVHAFPVPLTIWGDDPNPHPVG